MTHEGSPDDPRVTISDDRAGWTAAVTVTDDTSGRAVLTSLTVELDDRSPIDQQRLSLVPLRTVCEVAAAHIDYALANRANMLTGPGYEDDDGRDRFADYAAAADASTRRTGAALQRQRRPPLEEFAEVWKSLHRLNVDPTNPDGPKIGKREWLQKHYGVKADKTIDRWTRAARDAGHLPAAETGRPKTNQKNTTKKNTERND
jgi:hypothetical protein